MQEMQEEQFFEYEGEDVGEIMLDWKIDEFLVQRRSKRWYLITGALGVIFVFYAIFTSNFLFAIIILMSAVVMLLTLFTKPEKISVMVTSTGVVVGDMYYDFLSIRNFSIVYDPPDVKNLYLDFYAISHPVLSIPLDDVDPNLVRNALLPFCLENLQRTEESLTDVMRRLYKL